MAGIVFVVGFFPYIRAILRGKTKPAKASWIIWGTLDAITLAAMLVKGAINGQIVAAVICAWVVVILALRYGIPGWTRLDKFCLGGAVLGIFLWVVFGDAIFGIIVGLVTLFIGSFPTFASAWKDPSREDRKAWTIFWISCIFAFIAIPKWTFQDAGQPITFFLIESIVVYILYIHARKFKKV